MAESAYQAHLRQVQQATQGRGQGYHPQVQVTNQYQQAQVTKVEDKTSQLRTAVAQPVGVVYPGQQTGTMNPQRGGSAADHHRQYLARRSQTGQQPNQSVTRTVRTVAPPTQQQQQYPQQPQSTVTTRRVIQPANNVQSAYNNRAQSAHERAIQASRARDQARAQQEAQRRQAEQARVQQEAQRREAERIRQQQQAQAAEVARRQAIERERVAREQAQRAAAAAEQAREQARIAEERRIAERIAAEERRLEMLRREEEERKRREQVRLAEQRRLAQVRARDEDRRRMEAARTALQTKLQKHLHDRFRKARDVMSSDMRDQKRIDSAQRKIFEQISSLHQIKSRLLQQDQAIETQLDFVMDQIEREEERRRQEDQYGPSDVDALAAPADVWSNQLLEMSAENAAIDDTLYYLGRAIAVGSIDLDMFLRTTKNLAKRQFLLRAHMNKVSDEITGSRDGQEMVLGRGGVTMYAGKF